MRFRLCKTDVDGVLRPVEEGEAPTPEVAIARLTARKVVGVGDVIYMGDLFFLVVNEGGCWVPRQLAPSDERVQGLYGKIVRFSHEQAAAAQPRR